MLKEIKLKNGSTQLKGTTPKGTAEYAKVLEPQTKIGDQVIEPTYSMTLIMDSTDPQAENIIRQLQGELAKAEKMAQDFASKAKGSKKGKLPPCHDENFGDCFDDDGNPIDKVFIRAKAKAEGITQSGKKWVFKPTVFDAKGTPFPEKDPPLIGNGSVCRMAISAFPYAAAVGYGVSIRLEAVQVLKLVEFNSRSANSYGFETEEDGYSVSESSPFDQASEDEELAERPQPKSYRDEEESGDF